MDYSDFVPVARRLALEAGDRIMDIYNSDDFDVKVKSDDSPVTEADEAADALISEGLRKAFPDVLLVTEEQAASHSERAETFLIVDPLDGTKEFVHRRGDFTVNIAYVENGQTLTFPFDIEKSRALYKALLEPVDAEVKALDHLVFEPDGAMLRLPANLLVADDASVDRYVERIAQGGDDYDFTGTNWLGREVRITTTVSPSAFRDVRRALWGPASVKGSGGRAGAAEAEAEKKK